jgi:ATP-dependent exoDNAse (exonuclease V) alpha subunit
MSITLPLSVPSTVPAGPYTAADSALPCQARLCGAAWPNRSRVRQLAIAPAGAGKTTALRALTRAWIDSGGQVLGLAPSAAAAAQLRESIGSPTDTLAKLTWSVDHGDLPDWALSVGPNMLVIIYEAGMVDTLSLDAAVDFIVQRGGSVRLIGDNQQLAAIAAGGILRDIQAVHGADRLTELHRF